MGGKKSKPTIGYWYKLAIHFLIGKAIDAFLEARGGDKTAWSGLQTVSGTINIAAKNLWGGEKAEGGIEGAMDIMMGEATQSPNAYLGTVFGAKNPAFRGKATCVFKGGLYGAFNPYPKPMSFKVRRILTDWPDDAPWYAAKAPIPIPLAGGTVTEVLYEDLAMDANVYCGPPSSPANVVRIEADPLATLKIEFLDGLTYDAYSRWPNSSYPGYPPDGRAWENGFYVTDDQDNTTGYLLTRYTSAALSLAAAMAAGPIYLTGSSSYRIDNEDYGLLLNRGGLSMKVSLITAYGALAMNPAHMLYESVIASWGQGEPASLIDETSLTLAADRLYSEGFGLCMKFDPRHQTVEQFQRRIEQIIDGRFSQSRVDGKYYLTLIRDDYVLEDLPILTDDDIIEIRQEDSDPLESVNQVMVEWFDPEQKEKRLTPPVNALAAIRASGGVVSETGSYPEIPYEALALRVAARDLGYKSRPVKRFSLTTTRAPYAWLGGQLFRLQAPRRGIVDMVCLLAEISTGAPRSGTIRLKASQFVAAMRDTVYTVGELGVDHTPSPTPVPTSLQTVVETPYVELAGRLSAADLAALELDSSYLMAMAKRPSGGINYALYTAAGSEDLVDRGFGEYCPTAVVVEASDDPDETSFTLSDMSDLSDVEIGTGVLWGAELCRVDALDASAGTITLGRGCGDTTPQVHVAGERLWFYDDGASSDNREYAAGEVAHAKLLTRTSSAELALADATEVTVTMAGRKDLPYPPANVQVDGATPGGAQSETFNVTWAHRDRLLQADQLVDHSAASVGPEQNSRYSLQVIDDATDAVLVEASDLGEPTADVLLAANHAAIRLELWTTRDGLDSWQRYVSKAFAYTAGAAGAAFAAANPGIAGQINGTTPADPDVPLQPYVEKTGDTMTGALVVDTGDSEASVSVDADAGVVKDFRWRTGGATRWVARSNGDAESGANAGSNFELQARADDGSFLGFVFTASRATRVADWALVPKIASVSLDLYRWGAAGGTADAITATVTPTPTLAAGLEVRIRAAAANATTTPTLNVSGTGALTIKKHGGQALAAGDIYGAGHELVLVYSTTGGAHWELRNPAVVAVSGQAGVQFQDEGSSLGASGTVDTVDFVGAGVAASRAGNKVTVSISGGGGGGTTSNDVGVVSQIPNLPIFL